MLRPDGKPVTIPLSSWSIARGKGYQPLGAPPSRPQPKMEGGDIGLGGRLRLQGADAYTRTGENIRSAVNFVPNLVKDPAGTLGGAAAGVASVSTPGLLYRLYGNHESPGNIAADAAMFMMPGGKELGVDPLAKTVRGGGILAQTLEGAGKSPVTEALRRRQIAVEDLKRRFNEKRSGEMSAYQTAVAKIENQARQAKAAYDQAFAKWQQEMAKRKNFPQPKLEEPPSRPAEPSIPKPPKILSQEGPQLPAEVDPVEVRRRVLEQRAKKNINITDVRELSPLLALDLAVKMPWFRNFLAELPRKEKLPGNMRPAETPKAASPAAPSEPVAPQGFIGQASKGMTPEPAKSAATPPRATGPTAKGVSWINQQALRKMGYGAGEIEKMSPSQASDIVRNRKMKPVSGGSQDAELRRLRESKGAKPYGEKKADSTAIGSYHYDPKMGELHISAKRDPGTVYVYEVSPEQARAFEQADSKGKAWSDLYNHVPASAKIVDGKWIKMSNKPRYGK